MLAWIPSKIIIIGLEGSVALFRSSFFVYVTRGCGQKTQALTELAKLAGTTEGITQEQKTLAALKKWHGCHIRVFWYRKASIDSALIPSQLWPDSSSLNQCSCILDIKPGTLIWWILTPSVCMRICQSVCVCASLLWFFWKVFIWERKAATADFKRDAVQRHKWLPAFPAPRQQVSWTSQTIYLHIRQFFVSGRWFSKSWCSHVWAGAY